MTREQAELLKSVLEDAICKWHIDVVFPATIEQMIDAKIAFYEPFVKVELAPCYKEVTESTKGIIRKLQALKTIMEGK